MSTYPEIDPSQIRKGDKIRCEWPEDEVFAVEYKADCDLDSRPTATVHRLIDRPTPPVVLPETPTLAWVEWRDSSWREGATENCLIAYRPGGPPKVSDFGARHGVRDDEIVSLVAATAVPTAALDELRNDVAGWSHLDPTSIVGKFLAAVDDATEANR